MLKIIPTPIFMDVDKNKALKIKSLSLDESKINQAVVDDFYDFLDKLKIKVGDDCTDVVGFAFFYRSYDEWKQIHHDLRSSVKCR